MNQIKDRFPTLYHSLFPDFIERAVPDEKLATCQNCNLCLSPQSQYINTKCCSYFPHLANYLVGGVLQDNRVELAEGKNRIRQMIKQKIGVTPYGIIPPKWYEEDQIKSRKDEKLGKITLEQNTKLLCPYYDKGNCTIWDYRENLCSTFFCISVSGNNGKKFWKKTNEYLKMAENVLSKYAMHQMHYSGGDIIRLALDNTHKEEDIIDEVNYAKLWKHWQGKEEAFYINCYNTINKLDEKEFIELCGYDHKILGEGIVQLLKEYQRSIWPEFLLLNPAAKITELNEAEIEISYKTQAMTVSPILFTFIKKFNGRCTIKDVSDLAYKLIINLEATIDELINKGILIDSSNE